MVIVLRVPGLCDFSGSWVFNIRERSGLCFEYQWIVQVGYGRSVRLATFLEML